LVSREEAADRRGGLLSGRVGGGRRPAARVERQSGFQLAENGVGAIAVANKLTCTFT